MDRGISATSTRRPGLQAMLTRLAEGRTPYKAQLGYRNHHEWIDGREIRTIVIDPDRGDDVTYRRRRR